MNLFIDTNVFLSFLHFTSDDLEELRKLTVLLKDGRLTLWTPRQVVDEFARNRETKIHEALKRFGEQHLNLQFPQICKDYPEYQVLRRLQKEYETQHASLLAQIREHVANQELKADAIIKELFAGDLHASRAGTVFDIQFIGLGRFEGEDTSLTHSSSPTDTQDELRRDMTERFKLGLVGYAGSTPAAELLRVVYDAPVAALAVTPGNDPWNLWVFSVSAGGSARAQSRTSSTSVNGSLSANRTSENWKFRWGARANYREEDFEFSDGSTTSSLRRTSGTDVLVVRSVGPHWGVGGRASVTASTFSNQDLRVNIQPAVEYNIFPYAESSRRQLTFQYRIGSSRVRYDEETIFNVVEETLYEQMLTTSLSLQQPWGSSSLALTMSHFLDDIQKNRVTVFGTANIRIVRGLSLSFFGNIARVRDQVFLPRRGASDEEVLLRQRDLATDFDYTLNVNLRFTFGSIFNNIVNPRFDGGGGRIFFFN